jgi:hypothetical protein
MVSRSRYSLSERIISFLKAPWGSNPPAPAPCWEWGGDTIRHSHRLHANFMLDLQLPGDQQNQ